MRTCRVDELFKVEYGNGLELANLTHDAFGYNFIARGRKDNGVSSKVRYIPTEKLFPAGTITVAVSGSVMESFLQMSPYYTAYHVMILTSLVPMTTAEKLYYCMCLRRNKFKFSYGRQANESLPSLQIPIMEDIPEYVRRFSMASFKNEILNSVDKSQFDGKAELTFSGKLVPLKELFDIENGIAATQVEKSGIRKDERWIPFIRPSYRQSTSIDAYVNRIFVPQDKIFPRGTLYVSTNGQGSHTFSYVSVSEFVPNSDVSVLIPKRAMTLREKLAYSLFITKNRFKFSYGRKPKGEKLMSILVPDAIPSQWNNSDIEAYLEKM